MQGEVSGHSTQSCWDHRGLNFTTRSTSASRSKANLDVAVCSGLLSAKEKLDSQGVWSAIADPPQHFIIFFSFRLWLSQWIYVKLKEVPSANVTTSILYRLPQSASCERPRTRAAWRQIKSDRQKHPELQRCLKTDFTKNMMWAEATYPNPGQSTFLYKFHPLPIFSISTRKKGPAPCCYATVASVWLTAVSTQSQKSHARFSQEQNWSGRATGSQCIPIPSTPALLLHHHLSLQSL